MPVAPQNLDGPRRSFLVEPERFGQARPERVSELRRKVEAVSHEGRGGGQRRLDLVGDRKTGEEVFARAAGVLRGGKDGPQIVRRVAQFSPGEIAVHEVEVPDQRRVVGCRINDVGLSAADQRAARTGTAKRLRLGQVCLDGRRSEGADRACQGIEDVRLQALPPLGREVLVPRARRKSRDALSLARPSNDRGGFLR